MKFLVVNGAEIDKLTKKLWTPLHAATFNRHVEAAKWLVTQGANPHHKDDDGYTPLNGAAYKGLYRIIGELVSLHETYKSEKERAENGETYRRLLAR